MSATYFARTVWPLPLVADYGRTTPIAFATAAPYLLIVAVLAALTLAAWRWDRRIAFLGTWFFVTLAPASSIVPIATEVGAERRMYMPLAALVVLAVVGLDALSHRFTEKRSVVVAGVVGVMCAVFIGLSIAPADRLAVAQQLSGLLTVARLVTEFPLPDDVEAAPVFRP